MKKNKNDLTAAPVISIQSDDELHGFLDFPRRRPSLVSAVQQRSRARKLAEFFGRVPAGSTVLDVGVTANELPNSNYFLDHYPYARESYCGLGVEDMAPLRRRHPGWRVEQYDGRAVPLRMPFRDREFDFAFSNAVIEHVGSDERQVEFLAEMIRIARRYVYFTTPNRWFPVELHSKQFFRHWSRSGFDAWARRKREDWLSYPELNLLSRHDLVDRLHAAGAAEWEITPNRFLGVPMTFSVWIKTGG
jgi:hypothetical protein